MVTNSLLVCHDTECDSLINQRIYYSVSYFSRQERSKLNREYSQKSKCQTNDVIFVCNKA